jgi:hypothetical protein
VAAATARDKKRLERQQQLAEDLRLKIRASEGGVDVKRAENWQWTIEENELWEKKKARKARRADFEFHGSSFCHDIATVFRVLTHSKSHRRCTCGSSTVQEGFGFD